ncbi:MAG: hypothetical protein ACRD8U_17220 [Pyrinomonadaceae bacterium]
MKRCPECSFIYEDDQQLCDMDGKPLVHDLGPVPGQIEAESGEAKAPRSKRFATQAIAGMVLVAILFIAYYFLTRWGTPSPPNPTPSTTTHQSSSGLSKPEQYAPTSVFDLQIDRPEASTRSDTKQSEPKVKTKQVATKTTKTETAPDPRLTISKRIPPLRSIPPLPQLPAAQSTEKKSNRTQASTTVVIKAPEPAKTPSKSTTAANKKESKVGSFLKRTGRLLTKPFRF